MKFTIEREAFLKGLQRVTGIADPRGTMPILSNVLIETVSSDAISISATDLEISFKGEYSAIVDAVGSVTINAKRLFDIVKELQGEKADFSAGEDNWVTLLCNEANFRIPGLPPEEFPSIPSDNEDGPVQISISSLKDMVKKVIFSVSHDDTRHALTGVLLEIEGKTIRMISTDGHRLAFTEKEEVHNDSHTDKISIVIPKKTLSEILKMDDTGGYLQFSFFENYAVFKKDKTVLISRIIDAMFPSYTDVIPETSKYRAVVNKDQLSHALRRVSILADEKSKMIKFNFTNNSLTLIADTGGFGDAKESLSVAYEGENIMLGLNALYVLDVLNILSDEIHLNITDATSATLIGCPKNVEYKYVIMPMRIRSGEETQEE